MKIKCGYTEIDFDRSDDIMFNGACYQVISRTHRRGFETRTPIMVKSRVNKLIKSGDLVLDRITKCKYTDCNLKYYKIKE